MRKSLSNTGMAMKGVLLFTIVTSVLNASVLAASIDIIGEKHDDKMYSESGRPVFERSNNFALNCYYERELTEDCQKNFGYYCTETGQLATTKPTTDEGCDTCKCIKLAAASILSLDTLLQHHYDFRSKISRDSRIHGTHKECSANRSFTLIQQLHEYPANSQI